jgi:hypothetical protein
MKGKRYGDKGRNVKRREINLCEKVKKRQREKEKESRKIERKVEGGREERICRRREGREEKRREREGR